MKEYIGIKKICAEPEPREGVDGYKKDMNVLVRWHDLRKNPDDLPPIETKTSSIDVLTDRGDIAYYYYDEGFWCDYNGRGIDPPKAWCEIPRFEGGSET